MSTLGKILTVFLDDECGQDLVEYALIAGLVALSVIAGIGRVASGLSSVFTTVGTRLTNSV
jgi:pilus assembly protein Flp/PilA